MLYKKILVLFLVFGFIGSVFAGNSAFDDFLKEKKQTGAGSSTAGSGEVAFAQRLVNYYNSLPTNERAGFITEYSKKLKENGRTEEEKKAAYLFAQATGQEVIGEQTGVLKKGEFESNPLDNYETNKAYASFYLKNGASIGANKGLRDEMLNPAPKVTDYNDLKTSADRTRYNDDMKKYNEKQDLLDQMLEDRPELYADVLNSVSADQRQQMLERINSVDCGRQGAFSAMCRYFSGYDNAEEAYRASMQAKIGNLVNSHEWTTEDCTEGCTKFNAKVDDAAINTINGIKGIPLVNNKIGCSGTTSLSECQTTLKNARKTCNDKACKDAIDSALAIIDVAEKEKRYDPKWYGASNWVSALVNPDQNSLRASRFLQRQFIGDITLFDGEFLQKHLNQDFASQICLRKIGGELDEVKQTQDALGQSQGVTIVKCNQADDNNSLSSEVQFMQNVEACNYAGDLRGYRTKLLPNNHVLVTYSYYLRAPNDNDLRYSLFVGYFSGGNAYMKNITMPINLSAGSLANDYTVFDLNITNPSQYQDNTSGMTIRLEAILAGGGSYILLETPLYLQSVGENLPQTTVTDSGLFGDGAGSGYGGSVIVTANPFDGFDTAGLLN